MDQHRHGRYIYIRSFDPIEKLAFPRLMKNAQMQGARGAFHLPVRQAILRSEEYLNVRCNKPAPCLTRGRMRGILRSAGLMGVFQQPVSS